MFTYITLGTNNLARAMAFYDSTLASLGLKRCDPSDEEGWEEIAGWCTYENDGAQELALRITKPFNGNTATPGNGTMVALRATSWAGVAALRAGHL